MFRKKFSPAFSLGLAVLVGLLIVTGSILASTTIGTSIETGGALNVYGVSSFGATATTTISTAGALTVPSTALATFLGGATTTTLTLLNGEVISNATDGVIQLGGVASTTSITLLNGETITNAVDGTIALTGAMTVSGLSSLSNASSTMLSAYSTYFGATGTTTVSSTGALTVPSTALATFLGGATTTTLTLLNGEVISNAVDGTISFGTSNLRMSGTASSSAILVGTENNNTVSGIMFGFCTIADISVVTASTTVQTTCSGATGVTTSYRVFVQATSSMPSQIVIQSATSSTNAIEVRLLNTGITAGTPASAAVSLNYWAVR